MSPARKKAAPPPSASALSALWGAPNFVIQLIDKRKAEILRLVQDELQRMFDRVDVPRLIRNCLAENDIELRIRFLPRKR